MFFEIGKQSKESPKIFEGHAVIMALAAFLLLGISPI